MLELLLSIWLVDFSDLKDVLHTTPCKEQGMTLAVLCKDAAACCIHLGMTATAVRHLSDFAWVCTLLPSWTVGKHSPCNRFASVFNVGVRLSRPWQLVTYESARPRLAQSLYY